VSSPAVPWQRVPTMDTLQLHAPPSSLHSLQRRTQLNSKPNLLLAYNISARTTQKISHFHCCSPTIALLRIYCLVTGTCLQSRCLETVAVYSVNA
jgi:hypothetical protein